MRVAALPMIAVSILLLAVAPRYGPHWDELYFGMLPLQWWYVDQPPLTVWLTWLTTRISDALWVQRIPAVIAAAAGTAVAGMFPRLLGCGVRIQRLAAWAHAFTVYPLLMGHTFTTATIDLLAWQITILLVLRAGMGHRTSLVWAGVVAGAACWNKLLVAVLVAAIFAALLVTDRRLLRSREAVLGGGLFVAIAAPQLFGQLAHGLPMSAVSAGLVAQHGDLVRVVVIPALALFLGPPLLLVWVTGLLEPWRDPARPGRFLLPTVILVIAWTLAAPSQPYYPVGAALPALAMGWASPRLRSRWSPRKRYAIVAANSVVASVLCLPLLPPTEPWLPALSRVNPAIRDQVGWPEYARQIVQLRSEGEAVVIDTYALAGAVYRYGSEADRAAVYSGHNALWDRASPHQDRVLLVGRHAVSRQASFAACESVGTLRPAPVAHPQLEDVPIVRCQDPVADWATLWPEFRRLSG